MSGEKSCMKVEKFFNIRGKQNTYACRLVRECYTEIYKGLEMYFKDLLGSTNTVKGFVRKAQEVFPEYNYFWGWLEREGLRIVEELNKGVPNTKEMEDFLEYRKMILRMDKENEEKEMFFISVKEFLDSMEDRLKGRK